MFRGSEAMATVKYGVDASIGPNGDYLLVNTADYTYGDSPFSLFPDTWWVYNQAQTFDDYGYNVQDVVWGVRSVVWPGMFAW